MSFWSLASSLFSRVYGRLRAREPNLLGDRDVEWSWIAGHIPPGPGEALDFGSANTAMGLAAAHRGFNVTAVDLGPVTWLYEHPRLRFQRGDMVTLPLPEDHFDLVLSCSTVEHVGLVGRYDVAEGRPDGDLEAMARLRRLMKPGGRMLLTIPVGRDAVFMPMCRVYGAQRLPLLFKGYAVEEESYWTKRVGNRWSPATRSEALAFVSDVTSSTYRRNVYGLGLFVLRPA